MGLESKMADKYVQIQWKRKLLCGFESTKTVLWHLESTLPISDEAAKARGDNEARKDPINQQKGWSCEVKLLTSTVVPPGLLLGTICVHPDGKRAEDQGADGRHG